METAKNSLSLATERGEGFLSSRLLLPRASAVDGGNYTCQPSEALPASVLVHVLNGILNQIYHFVALLKLILVETISISRNEFKVKLFGDN